MRILVAVGLFSANMLPDADRPEGSSAEDDGETGTAEDEDGGTEGKDPPEPTEPPSTGRKRGRASRASTT